MKEITYTRVRSARRFWLAIGTFATGTDTFVIAGILPELARSFSVTIEAAGAVVSVYALRLRHRHAAYWRSSSGAGGRTASRSPR